jgi:phosphotransferase system HPr (HPr) family protein
MEPVGMPVPAAEPAALDACVAGAVAEDRQALTNAKSVLGVLSACVKHGDEIELVCEGTDEKEAHDVLSSMIQSGLSE